MSKNNYNNNIKLEADTIKQIEMKKRQKNKESSRNQIIQQKQRKNTWAFFLLRYSTLLKLDKRRVLNEKNDDHVKIDRPDHRAIEIGLILP